MANRRNVITLNGNRYNALTGELIKDGEDDQQLTPKASSPHANRIVNQGGAVDGFVKASSRTKRIKHTIKHSQRSVERSKTLMRSAVKKPTPKKISARTQPQIKPSELLKNTVREKRAKEISRSSLISKFSGEVKRITKFSQLPVTPIPMTENSIEKSLVKSAKSSHPPMKIAASPPSRFQSVLENSTSHQQLQKTKKYHNHHLAKKLRVSPVVLNVSIIVLAFTLLGGYFAYNNVSNLAMRVAATRAGISGNMPSYRPAGFSMKGPVQYQPGQISVQFVSNSDDRNFTLSQKKSKWNSETLLENHVATNRRPYQTFQEKGKTIYIYDGDSASWVDNGIWYEINGNEALNTDQLLRVANSL